MVEYVFHLLLQDVLGKNQTIPLLSVRRLQRYVSLFEILCRLKLR